MRFTHTVYSQKVVIHAPVERVWAILVDLQRYPEWNPFTHRVESTLNIGDPVALHVRMQRRGELVQQEFVRSVVPCSTLAWGMRLGHACVLEALREQRLERLDEHSCTYQTWDRFGGLLVPLVRVLFGRDIETGFNAVAAALKQRAERG